MKAAMLAARTTKDSSGFRSATLASRQPRPSVDAFVDACIRVKTSGIRSTPMPARRPNVAPAMNRPADTHSIMAFSLDVTRVGNSPDKADQGDDHCDIQERLLRRDAGDDDEHAHHEHADEIDGYHAVRQRGSLRQPDERQDGRQGEQR